MKKIFITLMCAASLFLLSACGGGSPAKKVLKGFEDLIEEVESKKGKLTIDEFKQMTDDFNARFEALGIDDIDEKDFSAVDKLKLLALTVRWSEAMVASSETLLDSSFEKMLEDADTEE